MSEIFSNPLAPPDHHDDGGAHSSSSRPNLTNDDFRKLLMTPRVVGGSAVHKLLPQRSASQVDAGKEKSGGGQDRKKKKANIKAKKEEEDELGEILKKYRDRARERRDGEGKEGPGEADLLQITGGYRAVAHDARSSMDAAARRKQMIQESKYLGGDMEHTHLVKGLDYSLLQKVRSEITSKEQEEEELETVFHQKKGEREEAEAHMNINLAKNIYRILFKEETPKMNELFAPRRMAYIIELDEETAETDIPTTLVRSKADCPVDEASTNLSTNDMVIQKLTQVLSYLRADTKRKKKDKEKGDDEGKEGRAQREKVAAQSIYDDAGEYVPNLTRSEASASKKEKDKSYFEGTKDEGESRDRDRRKDEDRDRRRDRDRGDKRNPDRNQGAEGREKDSKKEKVDSRLAQGWAPADLKQMEGGQTQKGSTKEEKEKGMGSGSKQEPAKKGEKKTAAVPDSYAECYPGGYAAYDAAGDSDEETDFTKMDLGNKKGPIRRWDFENEEDYEKYMSNREAMPKAAFQYGLKMNDGRKTRKTGGQKGEKDQKEKFDREWQKISKIIAKRKDGDGGDSESAPKKSKT